MKEEAILWFGLNSFIDRDLSPNEEGGDLIRATEELKKMKD